MAGLIDDPKRDGSREFKADVTRITLRPRLEFDDAMNTRVPLTRKLDVKETGDK